MRRVWNFQSLVPALALPLLATAFSAPLCAYQDPAAAALEPAEPSPFHRVFPPERPSQDVRLSRPAVTTDTPVKWEPPFDPVDWIERRKELTERIRLAAGLWPYPGAALDDVLHAVHERGDYSVENVLFQGNFFSFIPGNIYRPKGGAEAKPVVLYPHGHWQGGRLMERSDEEARRLVESGEERSFEAAKYPLQAGCAQLARMGCIVLTYDMVGFGEYTGHDHEGSFKDAEDVLRAQNVYGLQFWNSMMALNFMWNSPGTDRERVGMAGSSGGASQALFLAAAEKRITATFAAGMVSASHQGGCICENPSHLRVGTSNVEFAAAIAPRALALACADDWTRNAETEVLPALKKVWRMMGDEKDVVARTWPEYGHNFNVHTREMMYAFFNEHLGLGIEGSIVEQPFEPLTPAELRVYDADHPDPPPHAQDVDGVDAVFTENCDAQLELLFVSEDPHRVEVFRSVMFEALRLLLATELPPPDGVESELLGTEQLEGRSVRKLALSRAGAGEELPAVLVMPDEWNGTLVIGVSDGGKADFFGAAGSSLAGAARVVDSGAAFLAPDVLLTGEYRNAAGDSAPRLPIDEERHGRDVGYTYCYNRTLVGERVRDILTVIAYAQSLEGVKRLNLVGTGDAGPWVLMARGLVGELKHVSDAIQRTAAQWSWDYQQMRSANEANFLPGAIRYGGIPYFAGLIAPAELRLVGGPTQTAPIAIPELVLKAYRSLDKMDKLGSVGSRRYGELVDWLAEPAP